MDGLAADVAALVLGRLDVAALYRVARALPSTGPAIARRAVACIDRLPAVDYFARPVVLTRSAHRAARYLELLARRPLKHRLYWVVSLANSGKLATI